MAREPVKRAMPPFLRLYKIVTNHVNDNTGDFFPSSDRYLVSKTDRSRINYKYFPKLSF